MIQCQKLEAGLDQYFPNPKSVHQWVANSIRKKKKKGWVRIEGITVHSVRVSVPLWN